MQFLLRGISSGFRIGFNRSKKVRSTTKNMSSAPRGGCKVSGGRNHSRPSDRPIPVREGTISYMAYQMGTY